MEIVTMCFSQEPEKKSLVTLSFFFSDYFVSSYLPPQMYGKKCSKHVMAMAKTYSTV